MLSGMISAVDRRVNKKGEPWAIVSWKTWTARWRCCSSPSRTRCCTRTLVADSAVAIKGRVNWREDKMSVFGSGVVPLDISAAEYNPDTRPSFMLRADAAKLNRDAVLELRSTLMAHKGDTPVHLVMGHAGGDMTLAVDDDYRVTVSATLVGELKGIAGITVAT